MSRRPRKAAEQDDLSEVIPIRMSAYALERLKKKAADDGRPYSALGRWYIYQGLGIAGKEK